MKRRIFGPIQQKSVRQLRRMILPHDYAAEYDGADGVSEPSLLKKWNEGIRSKFSVNDL